MYRSLTPGSIPSFTRARDGFLNLADQTQKAPGVLRHIEVRPVKVLQLGDNARLRLRVAHMCELKHPAHDLAFAIRVVQLPAFL